MRRRWGGAVLLVLSLVAVAGCRSAADEVGSAEYTTDPPPTPAAATSTPQPTLAPATPVPASPMPSTVPTSPPLPEPTAPAPAAELLLLGSTPDGRFSYFIDANDPGPTQILVARGEDRDSVAPALRDPADRFDLTGSPEPFTIAERDGTLVVRMVHQASNSSFYGYVGRVDAEGRIVDIHPHVLIDSTSHSAFLPDDPLLLGLDTSAPVLADALTPGASTVGWWFRGATLGDSQGCGAATLYSVDAIEARRVLPEDVELDSVVAVEATTVGSLVGADAASLRRELALSVECAASYPGVRVHLATEQFHCCEGSPAPGQSPMWVSADPVRFPDGSTEVARVIRIDADEVIDATVGTALVTVTVEHLDGSVASYQVTHADRTTAVAASAPDGPSDSASDVASASTFGPDWLSYDYEGEVPVGAFALAVPSGAEHPELVVAGHRRVQVIPAPGRAPLVSDPLTGAGDQAFVSALGHVAGTFLLAVGGDQAWSPSLPLLMRWEPSTQSWAPLQTSVTAPTGSALRSSTPPAPPWASASGIVSMAEFDGALWATGWSTHEGEVRATVWTTTNGVDWQLEYLPGVEAAGVGYGRQVHVGPAGIVIEIGDATDTGAGAVFWRDPADTMWQVVDLPEPGVCAPSLALAATGDVWVADTCVGDNASAVLSGAAIGEAWSSEPAPGLPSAGQFAGLASHDEVGPLLWQSDFDWADPRSTVWQQSADGWVSWQFPGHWIGTSNGYAMLQASGRFFLVPLS